MIISTATKTRALLQRIFDDTKSTRPIIPFRPQKPTFDFAAAEQPFERTSPEAVGVSPQIILDFLRKLKEDGTLNMHSVLILRDDKVICEASFGCHRLDIPKYTFSACKSITSLAIGMLIDEGLLSLDDKLTDIFSQELGTINKLKFPELTVRRLLTMQSGVIFNEAQCMTEDNWVNSFFDSLSYNSGKAFSYNSLNTYMLAAVIKVKTGLGLSEYLAPRLFEPLGITEYYWEKCPLGTEKGGWGLYIKPEDFAKIGSVVMNNGLWKDRRIVSEQYIRAATERAVSTPEEYGDYDYGYQIWRCRDSDIFLFNGMFGQNVLGFRDNSIIVVTNAGNNETFQQSSFFRYVREAFDRPFENSIPHEHKASRELATYLRSLREIKPPVYAALNRCSADRPYPKGCEKLDGKVFLSQNESIGFMPVLFQVAENNYSDSVTSFGFSIEHDRFHLDVCEKTGCYHIPLGFDRNFESVIDYHGEQFLISAQAWLARNEYENVVLTAKIDLLETPYTRIFKFIFSPGGIEVCLDEMPGKKLLFYALDTYGSTKLGKSLLTTSFGTTDINYLKHRVERTFSPRVIVHRLDQTAII